MKKIDISTPKYPNTFITVDDEDYKWLNQWKWSATLVHGGVYAVRHVRGDRNGTSLSMHRFILDAPPHLLGDHKDGDTLNNTRGNLRLCTKSQNQFNRKLSSNNTSGYKGVHWRKSANKWHAVIYFNKKQISLGNFTCLIKGAKAYDEAATKYFGKFARLNFPEQS